MVLQSLQFQVYTALDFSPPPPCLVQGAAVHHGFSGPSPFPLTEPFPAPGKAGQPQSPPPPPVRYAFPLLPSALLRPALCPQLPHRFPNWLLHGCASTSTPLSPASAAVLRHVCPHRGYNNSSSAHQLCPDCWCTWARLLAASPAQHLKLLAHLRAAAEQCRLPKPFSWPVPAFFGGGGGGGGAAICLRRLVMTCCDATLKDFFPVHNALHDHCADGPLDSARPCPKNLLVGP